MKRRSNREIIGKRTRLSLAGQSQFKAPKTIEEYFALTAVQQDLWRRSTHVVSEVRTERASLTAASRASGVDPDSVLQLVGSALRKNASGYFVATRSDRLLRVLAIPTLDGVGEIATRDSREASRLATYWDYVQKYLQTGDASGLERFEGANITDANGVQVPLLTDLDELDRLGSAGELSFETIYSGAA
jgi:hypothetical protein